LIALYDFGQISFIRIIAKSYEEIGYKYVVCDIQ